MGQTLFYTTGTEVEEWTQAVMRHPGAISLLQQRCAVLPYHELFSYLATASPLLPEVREIYGNWLDEVLALSVMKQSEERLHSRINFAATCGPEVRMRLQNDSAFRQDFLETIWPRFRDSMIYLTQSQGEDSQDVFAYCGGEPLVWDFFKRPDSEILFRQVGMDAVILLKGQNALHPDLQNSVAAMWAKGILDLPQRMQEYQGNTHFLALAQRLQAESDWPWLNAVCLRLKEKGAQWPEQAAYLHKLSKKTLIKEINPKEPSIIPGAALFSLAERFFDGRGVGFSDLTGAAFDTADIMLTVLAVAAAAPSIGASIGALTVKESGKQVLKQAKKLAIQQTLRTSARESVEKLTKRTLTILTKPESTEWTQALAQEAFKRLPDNVRKTMVKIGIVDITEPVKAGFQLSRNMGLGRDPFKKLTKLEPRVFMRLDGRVFINFTNVITNPSPAASFLTRTTENGVIQSPPVEKGIIKAAGYVRGWKEDVSAWWIGHVTGQF